MASRSEEASLAPVDIYSRTINSWTQIWSNSPSLREENSAMESSKSCVCQRLKEPVILSDINITATTGCAHCQILCDSIMQFLPEKPEDLSPESWLNSISIYKNKYTHVLEVICKEQSFAPFSVEIFTNEGKVLTRGLLILF